MENTNWKQNQQGGYLSYHINVTYLGNEEPKYHVLKNPDGDGWVIGVFNRLIGGEYVPLEEAMIFPTAEEAENYIDLKLEKR